MYANPDRRGFAIIADVVASSKATDFVRRRDWNLKALSSSHTEKRWIESAYTVTAWDEFQTYSWHARSIPRALLELRQKFAPWELKIGIGAGTLQGWHSQQPVNESVGGLAFERARSALNALASGSSEKYRRLTCFNTGDEQHDQLLNLVYGLSDSLLQTITERQWETIGCALLNLNQDSIAAQLNVTPSTVTRSLQRGYYWQLSETIEVVAGLLGRSRLD